MAETLAEFIADLRRLRAEAGDPSLRDLERLSRKQGMRLPHTSAKDLLSDAIRAPSVRAVIAFVTACRNHALEIGFSLPDDRVDIDAWRIRVQNLASDESRGALETVDGSSPVTPIPSVGQPSRTSGPPISNLPVRNRHFSGREETLEDLHRQFRDMSLKTMPSVVAVHGLGGIGKSELAIEYAYRYSSDFDLIWWIPAGESTTVIASLASLGVLLGTPQLADQMQSVRDVHMLLRSRERWLLVYDNASSPDQLSGLLPTGGDGKVLITSQWSTWTKSAAPVLLKVLDVNESVTFLRHRLRGTGVLDSSSTTAPMATTDEAELIELADLVEGLPLALEEAAAYLEQTNERLNVYLQLLRERARELFGLDDPTDSKSTDIAERNRRRVATVWSVSLDRVRAEAPAAEALLSLLAFLAPEVPRELPAEQWSLLPKQLSSAVADPLAYNRLIAAIGRYSLVGTAGRQLRMHRLVQTVVQSRLGKSDERAWVSSVVALITAAFPGASWEPQNWATSERLVPHLLVAVGHVRRLDMANEGTELLLTSVLNYLYTRGQYKQAKPVAEQALATSQSIHGVNHVNTASRHEDLGHVLSQLDELSRAHYQYEQALRIGKAVLGPDNADVGYWRRQVGVALRMLGHLTEARNQLSDALRIIEANLGPDHREVARSHNALGQVLHSLGDLSGARAELEKALDIDEALLGEDHNEIGTLRNNLGGVLQALGEFEKAHDHYKEALRIAKIDSSANGSEIGHLHNNIGSVLRRMGELEDSRFHLEEALRIDEDAYGTDHSIMGIRRKNMGLLLRDEGDTNGAREQLKHALRISERALGPDHPQTREIRGLLDQLPPE